MTSSNATKQISAEARNRSPDLLEPVLFRVLLRHKKSCFVLNFPMKLNQNIQISFQLV